MRHADSGAGEPARPPGSPDPRECAAGAGNRAARLIRKATPDDAALLHRVAAETFPLACPPHTTADAIAEFIAEHLSEAAFVRYLADPQRAILLAEVDAEAAGYTMVVFGEPGDPDVAAAVTTRPAAELSKCYVRAAFHGAGVAQALVDATIDAVRAREVSVLWLGVNQENERANRFYAGQGFERVGTKRFLVGDRYEDDFTRAREL
jgi:ribosomal protein S18 acetylase RimI-like enzyme